MNILKDGFDVFKSFRELQKDYQKEYDKDLYIYRLEDLIEKAEKENKALIENIQQLQIQLEDSNKKTDSSNGSGNESYPILIYDPYLNKFYNKGLSEKAMLLNQDDSYNKIVSFMVEINDETKLYLQDVGWIGYAVRTLPVTDFRPYIKKDYSIKLNASHSGYLTSFYIEVKSKTTEVIKTEIELKRKSQDIELRLEDYVRCLNDWKDIYELCIVIIPHDHTFKVLDELIIKNLRLEKHATRI